MAGTGNMKEITPGLSITFGIAVLSFLASSLHPSFDALAISVIFGMLVGNMFNDREMFERGIDVVLKVFLPVGIGLYGLQLKFPAAQAEHWPAVFLVIAVMFTATYFISRGLGLDRKLAVLIGTGMSVCGAAAVVVAGSITGAKKEDMAISILALLTVGLTGMLIYAFLPAALGLSLEKFAFLAGTTLPMTGQVKVAAMSMGSESFELALNFKLMRAPALAVVALACMVLSRREGGAGFRIPWFIAVFFGLAIAVNASQQVAAVAVWLKPVSKLSLSVALAAVGLSIDFDSISQKGAMPLFASALAWIIVALVVYLTLNIWG